MSADMPLGETGAEAQGAYGGMGAEAQDPGMPPDQAAPGGIPPEGPEQPMGPEVPPQGAGPGSADPAGAQGGPDPVVAAVEGAVLSVAKQVEGTQDPSVVKDLMQGIQAGAQAIAVLSPPPDPNREAGLEEDRRVHEMEHERGLRELAIREQEAEAKAEQARQAAKAAEGRKPRPGEG